MVINYIVKEACSSDELWFSNDSQLRSHLFNLPRNYRSSLNQLTEEWTMLVELVIIALAEMLTARFFTCASVGPVGKNTMSDKLPQFQFSFSI